jgi:hypothetical protein
VPNILAAKGFYDPHPSGAPHHAPQTPMVLPNVVCDEQRHNNHLVMFLAALSLLLLIGILLANLQLASSTITIVPSNTPPATVVK